MKDEITRSQSDLSLQVDLELNRRRNAICIALNDCLTCCLVVIPSQAVCLDVLCRGGNENKRVLGGCAGISVNRRQIYLVALEIRNRITLGARSGIAHAQEFESIRSAPAREKIRTEPPDDGIGAFTAGNGVVTGAPVKSIHPIVANDGVVAGASVDDVLTIAGARDEVAAGATIDCLVLVA